MYSDGKIGWKINTDKGIVYKSSPDTISDEGVLTMVEDAMKTGPVALHAATPKTTLGKVGDKVWGAVKSSSPIKFRRTEEEAEADVELPPEVLARAREQGIDEKEIRKGKGRRKDEYGTTYELTIEQIIELNDLDDSIADTGEFWDAFYEMRRKYGIKEVYKQVRWSGSSEKKNYMTSWWHDAGWKKSGSGSVGASGVDTGRLAIALGVISATVHVINEKAETWRVSFADNDTLDVPTSYTSYQTRDIVISPQALLDGALGEDRQIEVSTGYGLHEGSHTQYSQDLSKALRQPSLVTPVGLAAMLLNIIEDVRIESLTGEKYPGFAGYFDTMNEYLWDTAVKKNAPAKWGPELKDKLNAIIAIVKWPDQFEPKTKVDVKLSAEFDWFRDWAASYLKGSLDARSAVLRAIAHLEEDPETRKEIEKTRNEEKAHAPLFAKDETFAEGVRRALESLRSKGVSEPCPSPHTGTKKLSAEDKAEVERLLREEYRRDELPGFVHMASGRDKGAPPVAVQRPETGEVPASPPNPLVNRMRHAFRFRKARPMYSNRLLRSGAMDEEELWRPLDYDMRIFEQRVIEEDPDTQVTLLVDASGSMAGDKIETAATLASVLLECLKDMKGVRVRVRAHTSENHLDYATTAGPFSWGSGAPAGGMLHIYRIWEPGDETRRINLLPKIEMTANYDGFAIAWCAEEMLREFRPGEDMVMIVIADGLPAGGSGFYYHGTDAIQHVRKVVDEYKKKNVHIIQLAIDPSVGPAAQEKMFGDSFIPYKDDASLPKQMTDFLIKLFGNNQ
jgi:hypothetical protein